MLKLKSIKSYLFYILFFLIIIFLFYFIYNKYNQNRLRNNIIKKINNSNELFRNINIETFLNNDHKVYKKNNISTLKKVGDLIDYSYYTSNKRDTHDMLHRDLDLYTRENIIEHMENEQNMNDLFPDLNKNEFSLNQNQSPKDLLVKPEFEADETKMSDALLNMDTRPDEQKELDSLLDDLNIYIYLLKNSILNDLNNKRDIAINQKITLYYNLFKDTRFMAIEANNKYNENKESPNYIVDTKLDNKSDLYLTSTNNFSSNIMIIYANILNKKDIDKNKDALIKVNIPIPSNLDSEEEEDNIDPLTILREFADNISSMYDSLNVIIAPYYNFVFELAIAPYPRDDDAQDPNSPDNKAGAAIIASFMNEMLSFSSSYNDAMINYIMNEDIFSALLINKNYKNNLLTLPKLTPESLANLNDLYTRKIIDDNQISSFDKSVQDATIIYNYFMSLYYIMKSDPDPEKIDVDTVEKILKGSVTFNTKDRVSLLKKFDPTVDNDEYTFGIKNMITNTEYVFVTPVIGFTTEKAVPASPSKSNINKKKNELAKAKEAMEKAAKAVAEAAEKAAKEAKELAEKAAKETERLAKEAAEQAAAQAKAAKEAMEKAAKETERIAKEAAEKAAKEAKELAEKTERAAKEAAEKAAKEAKELAEKTEKAAQEAAKEAEKLAVKAGDEIKDGAKDAIKEVDKGFKSAGKKIGNIFK